MNILDIILAIVLALGAIHGFRKGIIAQLCGIVGVLLGAWLAFKFGAKLGEWIGVELNEIVAYVIVFLVAVLVAGLAGRIAAAILKATGLGIINRLGGAALSVVEYALVASLLLGLFERINEATEWVEPKVMEESVLVGPVQAISDFVFPYLLEVKEAIEESDSFKLAPHDEESSTPEAVSTQSL
ncbi:MAG: CvpA family protein [Tidjanibacter sp.]|nr:CvpA family protein [Tidjanibacter sp.]